MSGATFRLPPGVTVQKGASASEDLAKPQKRRAGKERQKSLAGRTEDGAQLPRVQKVNRKKTNVKRRKEKMEQPLVQPLQPPENTCSFCGKKVAEVKHYITAPSGGIGICDGCVTAAHGLITENELRAKYGSSETDEKLRAENETLRQQLAAANAKFAGIQQIIATPVG